MNMKASNEVKTETKKTESTKKLKAWLYSHLIAQGGSEIIASSMQGAKVSVVVDGKRENSILAFIVDELKNPESRYYLEYYLGGRNPAEVIQEADSMSSSVD